MGWSIMEVMISCNQGQQINLWAAPAWTPGSWPGTHANMCFFMLIIRLLSSDNFTSSSFDLDDRNTVIVFLSCTYIIYLRE